MHIARALNTVDFLVKITCLIAPPRLADVLLRNAELLLQLPHFVVELVLSTIQTSSLIEFSGHYFPVPPGLRGVDFLVVFYP